MKNSKNRIQFLVSLANMDFGKLRRGDLLNLREDLLEFLKIQPSKESFQLGLYVGKPFLQYSNYVNPRTWNPPLPEDFSERDFHNLQLKVRDILLGPKRNDIKEFKRIRGNIGYYIIWNGRSYSLELTGHVEEVFLMIVVLLLVQLPLSVVHCRRQRCANLFYPTSKRQIYCSRRCANLESIKRWQEKQRSDAVPRPNK